MIDSQRAIFWNSLLKKSQNQISENFRTPSKPQAVYASAGKTGLKWVYAVKKDEAWVELEIMLPGDNLNSHSVFDNLHAYKQEIENAFGDCLEWEKIESRKSCRIQTKPRERYGVDDMDKWDELQEILITKMDKMISSLSPYIQQL